MKITLEDIAQIVKDIGGKHHVYCTFELMCNADNNYRDLTYQTYISCEESRNHQKHDTSEEAYKRFFDFYIIDDLDAYLKERTQEKIRQLREEREFLLWDIERLEEKLEETDE